MSSKSKTVNLKLYFPDANGGPNIGPSDAGAQFFAGNLMANLARECAQNAIDARKKDKEPIKLSFKLEQMNAKDIPEYSSGLKDAWMAADKRWSNDGKDYQDIFTEAKLILKCPKVPVLVISDYKTKGLEGIADRKDDSKGSWTRLVKSTGVANSSKGAGGAFGIGKMAPFACSALRTVFYQTCSKDGWGFQGVVRLMTHRDAKTERTLQSFGMIGQIGEDKREKHEISLPVESRHEVPEVFRDYRKSDTFGTDIFIIGFVDSDDWKVQVKAALITNFFPAIMDNYAEFEIQDEKINKDNILAQLASLKKEAIKSQLNDLVKELEHTFWYIKARTSMDGTGEYSHVKKFKHFGNVAIGITQATKDEIKAYGQLPGRCFMCRSNRMKIFSKPYQLAFPFASFMICDDEAGNELLRRLEPPTHSAWEKDRDKSNGREHYAELTRIYAWIREEVAKLAPPVSDESQTLESVARAIKGLDIPEENAGSTGGNDADSLIKKGIKRSPFNRTSYSNDKIKLKGGGGRGGDSDKKYKKIDIDSSFVYRGNGRYVLKVIPKVEAKFLGNEILKLFAINFSGSADAIAFTLEKPNADDRVDALRVTRSSDSKFADIHLPLGHEGEIALVIKTEVDLLSLTAQLLKPAAEVSETSDDSPKKRKK